MWGRGEGLGASSGRVSGDGESLVGERYAGRRVRQTHGEWKQKQRPKAGKLRLCQSHQNEDWESVLSQLYTCLLQRNQPAEVRSRGTEGIMAGPRVRARAGSALKISEPQMNQARPLGMELTKGHDLTNLQSSRIGAQG